MNLRGATALVTGATGGIGQAIAAKLAAHGSELVLTGRRADILESMAEKLNGRAFPADLADERAIEALLVAAGPIDVVVANAALPATGLLADYSGHQIDRALSVNLRAPILMAKLAGEGMVARRRGHLVFINSLSGKTASGYASLYNATKFGMRGFALALREDLRTHNVGVSTIFPGYVRNAGMFADSGAKLPVGIGTRSPEDVAGATVRAIERDLAEVDVAPWPMRMIGWAGGAAPWLAAAIQRRAGADAITAQLAEGQRYKR